MKQLAELIPIALFFISYKMDGSIVELAGWTYTFDGIYSATAILMAATTVQLVLTKIFTGTIDKKLWLLFTAVVVFGSATLFFRSEAFIQWKPTVFNWVLACFFIGAPLLGKKTLLERGLSDQVQLPAQAWQKLNILWTANFVIVGALNIFVAYKFSESFWVSYKLYSSIGFVLLLTILTAILMAPHISEDSSGDGENSTN
ncbi:MAG: inner membrane-spanning protein YciB [Pseudomonadales bacterium]